MNNHFTHLPVAHVRELTSTKKKKRILLIRGIHREDWNKFGIMDRTKGFQTFSGENVSWSISYNIINVFINLCRMTSTIQCVHGANHRKFIFYIDVLLLVDHVTLITENFFVKRAFQCLIQINNYEICIGVQRNTSLFILEYDVFYSTFLILYESSMGHTLHIKYRHIHHQRLLQNHRHRMYRYNLGFLY